MDFINGEIDRASPRDYVGVVAFAAKLWLGPADSQGSVGDWRLAESSSHPCAPTRHCGGLRWLPPSYPKSRVRLVLLSAALSPGKRVGGIRLLKAQGVKSFSFDAHSERAYITASEIAVRELALLRCLPRRAFDLKAPIAAPWIPEQAARFSQRSIVAERDVHLSRYGEKFRVGSGSTRLLQLPRVNRSTVATAVRTTRARRLRWSRGGPQEL